MRNIFKLVIVITNLTFAIIIPPYVNNAFRTLNSQYNNSLQSYKDETYTYTNINGSVLQTFSLFS